MKRIGIFGAGAVGSALAARLAQAGHPVSLIGRAAHVQAIGQDGLQLRTAEGVHTVAVQAYAGAAQLPMPVDLVLVTLKAHSLAAAAEDIRDFAQGAPVVFVVNGIPWWYAQRLGADGAELLERLDPQAMLRQALAPEQVFGGVVRLPAQLLGPGQVRINGGNNTLVLGSATAGAAHRLQVLADTLNCPGLTVHGSADLALEIWQKLLTNLPSSLLSTLSMAPSGELLQDPALEAWYRGIVQEGVAVAQAYGVPAAVDVSAQVESGRQTRHLPSMLQDLIAGKPLELDAQLEAVLALAQRRQVATPLIASLLGLLRLRSRFQP